MPDDRLEKIHDLFDRAAELPASKRRLFLDEACDGDDLLRAEVEALLAADEAAGQFLAEPTIDAQHAAARIVGSETVGSKIGHYTLLQSLGDGGFGTVFLAEQKYPVRRQVAIKIIKLGMDTRQVISRFEAERQALAMMDHPGIARVFDAGSTETGRPYFVMEYVSGESITRYCDRERLSVADRLRLFVTVCQAVQHAHQKGIIHRDLKPGNVLVTLVDGQPVAKVIDFGIAKAASPSLRLTDATMHTQQDQLLGTPKYMSPEQATVGGGEDVDTRSDVYSLGVMLYELLIGTTPFDEQSLRNATYADLQRVIREVDPPRPSTRLSSMRDTIRDIAAVRGMSDPKQLRSALRGELDWIVMKCLEKQRTRRYDSASALATDLQRFLRSEPVEAGPPTRRYRLRKFVARHYGTVLAALLVLAVLVGGIVTTTLAAYRASRAEQLAVRERQRMLEQKLVAERRFNDVRKLAGSFIFEIDDAIQKEGPTKARERLVKTAIEYLDALAKESAEPELLRELQESYKRVGMVQYFSSMPSIGDPAGAKESYRKSLEIAQRLLATHPDDKVRLNDVAGCWYYLADAQWESNDFAGAQHSWSEALGIYRKLSERFPEEWLPRRNAGMIMHRQAVSAMDKGRYDEARDLFMQTLDLRERLLAERPGEAMLQRDVRVTASSLAMTLVLTHEPAEALSYLRRSASMLQELVARSPQDSGLRRELYSVMHRLAEATRDAGDVAESLQISADLVVGNRQRVADDPADREAPLSLSGALYTLGKGRLIAGPLDDALRAFEESRALRAASLKVNPNRNTERWLADSIWRVAETLRRMGRYDQAEIAAREGVALNQRRLVASPEVVTVAGSLVSCNCELALALAGQGRFDEALAAISDPLANSASTTAPASRPASQPSIGAEFQRQVLETRGEILVRAGRLADARAPLEQAIALDQVEPTTAPATRPAAGDLPVAATARVLLVRALAGERNNRAIEVLTPLLGEAQAYLDARPNHPPAIELLMLARRAEYEALSAAGQTDAAARAAGEAVVLARRLLNDPDHAAAREIVDALHR